MPVATLCQRADKWKTNAEQRRKGRRYTVIFERVELRRFMVKVFAGVISIKVSERRDDGTACHSHLLFGVFHKSNVITVSREAAPYLVAEARQAVFLRPQHYLTRAYAACSDDYIICRHRRTSLLPLP